MNSVWILIAVAVWMYLGYRFYARFIEKRLQISDKKKTPAVKYKDNIDFSPAKKSLLMGHHFASIAGAGPIIGPILAISYFGWLPVVFWLALGSVLIGAMHDFVTLVASARNKAVSVSRIAENYLGLMIWLSIVLVVAVFSVSAAESIVGKPDLVIPLVTITLLAVLLGTCSQKLKINFKLASILAIALVFVSVWLGYKYPITLPINDPALLKNIWTTIIIFYAGLASVLPVWLLLRPRDFLSAIQMGLILVLGILAVLIMRPVINAPAYIAGSPLPLWPILFITVACGAISGFHGIVASGTTSKQLAKESHAKPIGYGGMLMEGALGIFVTVVAIAGLKWGIVEGGFQDLLQKGWIVLFSSGYGNIVGSLGVPLITVGIAALLGAFMVNQFVLTTVDTATRLGRFVISEALVPMLKNRFVTTLIVLVPAWLLAVTKSYDTIWRLFGTSNQLIASISLITVAAFFVYAKKKLKFILIPAVLVLATTLSALAYLTLKAGGYLAKGDWLLVAISTAMFVLGIVVAIEGFMTIFKPKENIKQRARIVRIMHEHPFVKRPAA
jgi:carbon starvation protein